MNKLSLGIAALNLRAAEPFVTKHCRASIADGGVQ